MRTVVYGTLNDSSGTPYEGAILKFLPNTKFKNSDGWVQDTEVRVTTNSYGKFEITLAPSPTDGFYFMSIVYDKITTSAVIIPESSTPVNFLDLTRYLYPYERHEELGQC